ncbi:hypothetical protein AgCh_003369 [Apium graveolens]
MPISRTERSMNRDPDAYRYKWSNGSNNFLEYLDHFVSEQKSRFRVLYRYLWIQGYKKGGSHDPEPILPRVGDGYGTNQKCKSRKRSREIDV